MKRTDIARVSMRTKQRAKALQEKFFRERGVRLSESQAIDMLMSPSKDTKDWGFM